MTARETFVLGVSKERTSNSFHSSCPDVTRDLRSKFAATGLRSQTVRRQHYAYYYPPD